MNTSGTKRINSSGEKHCLKCDRWLPIESFGLRAQSKTDGHQSSCKDCQRAYIKAHQDYIAEYNRQWKQTPNGKESHRQAMIRSQKKHREKVQARWKVKEAIRTGRLVRLPCQFCGDQKSQAHHDDYDKPLDVVWVCHSCHIERFHSPESKVQL